MSYDVVTFSNFLSEVCLCQNPSSEAFTYMESIQTENPQLMLDFLVDVIKNEEIDSRLRLSAIKMMNVPFQSCNICQGMTREESIVSIRNNVSKLFDAVGCYIVEANEAGVASRENFVVAMNKISKEDCDSIFTCIFNSINESTDKSVISGVVKMVHDCDKVLSPEMINTLHGVAMHFRDEYYNNIDNDNDNNDNNDNSNSEYINNFNIEVVKMCLDSISKSCHSSIYSGDRDIMCIVVEIFKNFVHYVPQSAFELIDEMEMSDLLSVDRDFEDFIKNVFFSDTKFYMFCEKVATMKFPDDFNYEYFVRYSFSCVLEKVKSGNIRMTNIPTTFMTIMSIINNNCYLIDRGEINEESLWCSYFDCICEFMSESDECMTVVAIDSYVASFEFDSVKTMNRVGLDFIISHANEMKTEVITARLVNLQSLCVERKYCEVEDSLIDDIYNVAMNEDADIEKFAGESVIRISSMKDNIINNKMFSMFFNGILDETMNADSVETCYKCAKIISKNISDSFAASWCETVFDQASSMFNEERSPMMISKLVGIMCVLISSAGDGINDNDVNALYQFASSISKDFENDAIAILDILCSKFSSMDKNLIDDCANIVISRIPNFDNPENFFTLSNLAMNVIKQTESSETLTKIVESLAVQIQNARDLRDKRMMNTVSNIVHSIHEMNPDVTNDMMRYLVSCGFVECRQKKNKISSISDIDFDFAYCRAMINEGIKCTYYINRTISDIEKFSKNEYFSIHKSHISNSLCEILTSLDDNKIIISQRTADFLSETFPENIETFVSKLEIISA